VVPKVFVNTPDDRSLLLDAMKREARTISRGMVTAQTQLAVAQAVPLLVNGGFATTIDDVLDRLGNHIVSPNDRALAQRSLDAALQQRRRFEASAQKSPQEFLKALGTKKNITVHGMLSLTTTPDLLGFINNLRAPQLPEGSTVAEMREVLGAAGITSELSLPMIQDAEDFSRVINRELDTLATRAAMWEADLINAIDGGEFAQSVEQFKEGISFLDNPGLYIGLPLSWMDRNYWKPLAGFVTHELGGRQLIPGGLPGDKFFGVTPEQYTEFEGAMLEAKASGESTWIAYGKAFEDQDTNWVSKMIVEMLADPTSYLGFGVAKIFKPIPIVYPAVRAFEKGWVRAWDLPFVALQKGTSSIIPKLAGQVAEKDSLRHVQVAIDYLNSSHPRGVPAQQMSMSRIRDNMNLALETLQKNPHHSGAITDSVRGLLERPMLTPEDITQVAASVNRAVAPEDVAQIASDLDTVLSHSRALPGGMSHTPPESIDMMLGYLGADRTEANIKAVGDMIRRQRQQSLTRFESIVGQGNFKDFIGAIIEHRKFVGQANQRNPVSAYRNRTAMLMASMSSNNRLRPALTTLASTFDMLHRFSYGFTRMYLMSTFYGPFNILETAVKSAVMSINPRFRGKPLLELQRNMMGFETIAPRIFLQGEVFLPQAQDIATAGATARGRTQGSRGAYKRIWTTKQNILRKLYASSDEFFIQTGARLGLEQAAHVLNVLSQRHLFENSLTGPVTRRVADMTAARTAALRPHMAPDILEMHQQEMLRLAIQDPAALDTMAADFVPGFAHAARVQEILSKYTTLDPAIREHLTNLTIDGDLFRLLRTNELDTRVSEAIWQQIFAEPEIFLARIRELTNAVLEIPPDTLEQLQVQVRMLEELNSATTHIVEQQMSATQAYTRDILNLDKKNDVWQGQWDNIIQPVMAAGTDSANQIAESLLRALREKGFDLPRQALDQYTDLVQKQLVRMRLVVKARESINEFSRVMLAERDNEIIPRIRRAGGKPNSDHPEIRDWWQRFNGGRDRIWREAQSEIAESIADTSAVAGAIDAFPVPQAIDVSGRPLVMADVAYLYGAAPDAITNGMYLADLKMMRPKAEWVNTIYAQARRIAGTAPDSIGFTKERLGVLYDQHLNSIRIRPEVQNLSAPRFVEWDALHKELQTYAQASDLVLRPGASEVLDREAKGLLADLAGDPVGGEVLGGAWTDRRRGAFQDAVDEYNINFPVYDQNNAFNAGMRFMFPFWTYEAHRWSYLPRVALRNPGLTHAWGTYNDSADRGYIPIPGTSLQVNPLRNMITMGGMHRAMNRDFPEFYDQFPDLANYVDQLGRIGFYPNVYLTALQASPFFNRAGVSQMGEVVPPPIGTVLEAIIAVDPDNAFADALAEIILPNRFRDYRVAIRMAENLPEGQGARASEILFKKLRGEEFTPEEDTIWNSAERASSILSIWDYQVGMTRLRPEEMVAARELAKQIILRYVPISEEQYDEARKLGMPIEQYYPFPVELNDELRAVEEIARWRGLTTHLGESLVAQMLLKQRDYWSRVEDRRDEVQIQEAILDQQFRMTGEGHITRNEWRRLKNELGTEMNRFVEDLKRRFEDDGVPIEYQDRLDFAKEHNTLAPIQHPIEEMITYYFGKQPEDFRFFDSEVGSMVTDWDGFYKWRTTLEDSLEGPNRESFMNRTRRWDSDLDTFRREDYETFIRPHKAMFSLTLDEFSDGEQRIIRQFYATDSASVRGELREIERGDGARVVSGFQSQLSERRRRLRLLDPEIDARLAFWGETSSVASDQARAIHDSLYGRYGIQVREVIPVESFEFVP
jgi:hypothetical protein